MRIACLSDTHSYHRRIQMPEADMLIFAGDLTMRGEIDVIQDFNVWLGELPYQDKVVIAGNHDIGFARMYAPDSELITNAIYLQDQFSIVNGVKIYGSPWTPFFYGDTWVFNQPRGIGRNWEEIPEGLDILVTHGPPNRILDKCDDYAGDVRLMLRLKDLGNKAPRYHVFGHIHEAYGRRKVGHTEYLNVSVLDGRYRVKNAVQIIDLD